MCRPCLWCWFLTKTIEVIKNKSCATTSQLVQGYSSGGIHVEQEGTVWRDWSSMNSYIARVDNIRVNTRLTQTFKFTCVLATFSSTSNNNYKKLKLSHFCRPSFLFFLIPRGPITPKIITQNQTWPSQLDDKSVYKFHFIIYNLYEENKPKLLEDRLTDWFDWYVKYLCVF